MSQSDPSSPRPQPDHGVEVVAHQTQDGAFEIQVTRPPTGSITQPVQLSDGSPRNSGSMAAAGASAPEASSRSGLWMGAALLGGFAVAAALVMGNNSAPPDTPSPVVPTAPEAEPEPPAPVRGFSVHQDRTYRQRNDAPIAGQIRFAGPVTAEAEGSVDAAVPDAGMVEPASAEDRAAVEPGAEVPGLEEPALVLPEDSEPVQGESDAGPVLQVPEGVIVDRMREVPVLGAPAPQDDEPQAQDE